MNIIRVLLGGLLAIIFAGGLLDIGLEGFGVAGFFGVMLALCVRWFLVGVTGLAGRPMEPKVSWGLFAALALLATLAGPSVSHSFNKSTEEEMFAKAQASGTLNDWELYRNKVKKQLYRPEYEPLYLEARAKNATERKNAVVLRDTLKQLENKKDPAYEPARKAAQIGLGQMYDEALKSLHKGKNADRKLLTAFDAILEDLSKQPDPTVYVVFRNQANLKPPPGANELLARMKRDRGNLPVTPEGDAFSKAFDLRRRDKFLEVFRESFSKVFTVQGLFALAPLPESQKPAGNLVFLVDSVVVRTPTFFEHSRNNKVMGFLYGIEVLWSFSVVDRQGKVLYTNKTESEPAKSVRFRVRPDDPAWAPYSIMMDSAYDNYARQVVVRFGLTPPPEKQYFEFTR